MQKGFNPGDEVAIVVREGWRQYLGRRIKWRGQVTATHKTGAVVVEPGKYRPNGSPYNQTYYGGELVHVTPELEAEIARHIAMAEAENAIFVLREQLHKLRGEEALAMAKRLQAAGIIEPLTAQE